MYKHPQNAILPLSIAAPISQQGTQVGYGDKNKGKQLSPIYSKIIKQPQKKDKERQKVKENNTNISIKTMEQSLQNVRPILQKKQSNKELLTVPQKNRTINHNTQYTKVTKNQSIRTNIHNNKGLNDKKTKNTYSNLKSLNNSQSLGKIKPSNTLNPIISTQMKPKDDQNKNKNIGNSNFSKYGKFEKFIKQTNKNIQKYNEKEDKQPEPVIDIKIHVQNRQNDRQRQIKNHSFINSLQEPTKFLQQSVKNSPQPSNYQSKRIQISGNGAQNLNKKYNSQNKLKRYDYLSLIPTQIVHEIDKNMINKDSVQKESVKYNSRRKSIKNNYQNFRIKRSQQNSINQLSQINSFNQCNLYKNLQQASLNKQHYINPAHRLHSHGSTLRLRSMSGGKSVSLIKNNGSFVNNLGYMDDSGRARRSRRRSLESRSKGSIRQQSIQFQVNKLQNRCKKMLNNLQTPKEGYRHKYNYLEEVEFQKEKDRQQQRLKQKQRQLLQRQRKLIQKQRDIQRRNRKQIVFIQSQKLIDRERQRRKEKQRQILKIDQRQRDYQMNNEKRRRLQEKQRIQRELRIRKTLQMQKQIQRQKKRELQKQQQLKRAQIKSKRQIYSNIRSPLKEELCNSVHNNPNKYQTITQTSISTQNYNLHQSQNYKPYQQNTQKRTFVYPIQNINTSTNKTHNNLTTPYRNTAQFNSKQASYQSPIDKINVTSARPNIRQKQACACMHDCQCNDITGQLNTSRINRINNKLEQYIARNMKSGRDTFEHHPHYH